MRRRRDGFIACGYVATGTRRSHRHVGIISQHVSRPGGVCPEEKQVSETRRYHGSAGDRAGGLIAPTWRRYHGRGFPRSAGNVVGRFTTTRRRRYHRHAGIEVQQVSWLAGMVSRRCPGFIYPRGHTAHHAS